MNPSWRRPISNWREGGEGRGEERVGGREGGGKEVCDRRKGEGEKGSKSN